MALAPPTHRAAQEKKEDLYADLQVTTYSVHVDDVLLLVGEFNTRVGSNRSAEYQSMWERVRGSYGIGMMNENGEALLSFCALNELTILNTFLIK